MGRWPRRISRSKHSSTPLIFSPCRAIKDFTALLLPVGTHEHSQVGQRRSTPFFGCGADTVAVHRPSRAGLLDEELVGRVVAVGGACRRRSVSLKALLPVRSSRKSR